MINADLSDVKTLEEFYTKIRSEQENAHGEDYCAQHDAIKKLMPECESYLELGTHQGATAACAILAGAKKVQLVDIDMSRFTKYLQPIAVKYCMTNDIDLKIKQVSSTAIASIASADMMLIDSLHRADHMKKELDLHGPNIQKYIIAHDTSVINGRPNDSLYATMSEWAKKNGWKVFERVTKNVGYTVIKRL